MNNRLWIAPIGVIKRPRTVDPYTKAVYEAWMNITLGFKIRYDSQDLQDAINESQLLSNLDKKGRKTSYKNAYLKFRREKQATKRR